MDSGYIKLWRKMQKSSTYRNSEAVHLFVHLLFKASYQDRQTLIGHQIIDLKPGQVVTGRKALAKETGINEYKVYRLLGMLETAQQIAQQTFTKYSIISICNWSSYQDVAQQTAQQAHNKCTSSAHKEEVEEVKKGKKESKVKSFVPPTEEEVAAYCKERSRGVNPDKWMAHYQANGWMVGKSKMVDWKAAVRTWESEKVVPLQPQKMDEDEWAERVYQKTLKETNRG